MRRLRSVPSYSSSEVVFMLQVDTESSYSLMLVLIFLIFFGLARISSRISSCFFIFLAASLRVVYLFRCDMSVAALLNSNFSSFLTVVFRSGAGITVSVLSLIFKFDLTISIALTRFKLGEPEECWDALDS